MTIGTMDLRGAPTEEVEAPARPRVAVGRLAKRLVAVGAVGAIVAAGLVYLPDVFESDGSSVADVAVRDTEVVEIRDLSLDVEEKQVEPLHPAALLRRNQQSNHSRKQRQPFQEQPELSR